MSLRIETFTLGAFSVNVYLATDEATGTQALIDTSETDDVLDLVKDASPSFILLTHAHLDHVAALPVFVARRRMMKMEPPVIYLPEDTI